MQHEQSAVSKTSSHGLESNANTLLVQGKAEVLDTLFPLWDQISNSITLPNIVYLVCLLYIVFQLFMISFWPTRSPFVVSSTSSGNAIQIMYEVALITPVDTTSDNILYFFLGYTAAFVIVLALFLFNIIYFNSTRTFIKGMMYPTRFFIEIVPMLLLMPMCAFFASVFVQSYNNSFTVLNVFVIILLIIYYIFFVILFSQGGKIIAYSAFLSTSDFATFDFPIFSHIIILNSVIVAVYGIFEIYKRWADYLIFAVHLLILAFQLFSILHLPMVKPFSNNALCAVLSEMVILDIIRFFSLFLSSLPGYTLLIIAVVALVVLFIFFNFYNEVRIKRIALSLSYNLKKNVSEEDSSQDVEEILLTEEQKIERFRELGLDKQMGKVKMYLHYGLSCICDLFTDFSLLKFVVDTFSTTQILTYCIRLIDFFPTEVRLMNLLLSMAMKRRDLNSYDRFLIFQVNKIKILRQSSSSHASNQKLAEMKQETKECENSMRSFWSRTEINLALFHDLYNMKENGRSMWNEVIRDYPNSVIHHEEYANFLIECATDFEKAVFLKHKAEMIESGANYSVDLCFRSLIRCYPDYLKKKILDLKGNLIKTRGKKKGSQSSNKTGANSFSSLSNVIDARMEEEIGRTIILQAKMRLALQHATEGRKATNSTILSVSSIISAASCIAILTAIFVVFRSYFSDRYSATSRDLEQNHYRLHLYIGTLYTLLRWGKGITTPKSNVIDVNTLMTSVYSFESPSTYFVNQSDTYSDIVLAENSKSLSYYTSFLLDISNQIRDGNNVYNISTGLTGNSVPIYYCNGATTENIDYKEAMIYSYLMQRVLTDDTNYSAWLGSSPQFCALFSEFPSLSNSTDYLSEALLYSQRKTASSTATVLSYFMIYFPIGMVAVAFIPEAVISYFFVREVRGFGQMLLSLDLEYKQAASNPIRKNCVEETNGGTVHAQESIKGSYEIILYWSLITGLFAIIIVAVIGIILFSEDLNNSYLEVGQWESLSSPRASMAVECLISIYLAIILSDSNPSTAFTTNITNSTAMLNRAMDLMDEMDAAKDSLASSSFIGFDTTIDTILVSETCTTSHSTGTLHDTYECSSANQLQTILRSLLTEATAKVDTYEGMINTSTPVNMFHLVFAHLLPMFTKIDNRLDTVLSEYESTFDLNILYVYISGVIVCFLLVWSLFGYINYLNNSFDAAMALLRRVPPAGIVANTNLIEYLMNRFREVSNEELTISRAIIRNSADGIFCMGISGIIESINPSVSHILGYTPEQMLGQYIGIILEDEEREKIEGQMKLMLNKQSAMTYEDHIICISDNDSRINCQAIILGMTNGSSKEVDSFVMIIRNEEELVKQRQEAEDAKAQSENLLYQILPRDIVVRLNQGEKDVSFSVPSATIMFIDIVKFSEYTASLTPQEIMSYLSALFGAFDDCLAKYPLLTKIKLIGDVYMCAGGLFNPNESPAAHAEQVVRFGLDALQQLEETNIKQNANLNVRIGVNTGGPLIAGILGTDKPMFDIIGDPINIASRLQSTDVPGRIQISQQTYDLIAGISDFVIEQRGEVFLKGKGKTHAYLVRPSQSFVFQLSSTSNTTHSFVANGVASVPTVPNAPVVPIEVVAKPAQPK